MNMATKPKKRHFSPEARERIRIAQMRRWREWRKTKRVKAAHPQSSYTAKRLKTLAASKR
jgi:hypothetical protein